MPTDSQATSEGVEDPVLWTKPVGARLYHAFREVAPHRYNSVCREHHLIGMRHGSQLRPSINRACRTCWGRTQKVQQPAAERNEPDAR